MTHDNTAPARRTLIAAATLGLLGVAAGAFGAHGLESRVGPEQLEWWETAARYQQIHSLALLLVGWGSGDWSAWRTRAALAFTAGILVFSGTLYAMALGGPRVLGAITPMGGLCLMAGWGLIAIAAAARKKNRPG